MFTRELRLVVGKECLLEAEPQNVFLSPEVAVPEAVGGGLNFRTYVQCGRRTHLRVDTLTTNYTRACGREGGGGERVQGTASTNIKDKSTKLSLHCLFACGISLLINPLPTNYTLMRHNLSIRQVGIYM